VRRKRPIVARIIPRIVRGLGICLNMTTEKMGTKTTLSPVMKPALEAEV
jgi:hypothetical protein